MWFRSVFHFHDSRVVAFEHNSSSPHLVVSFSHQTWQWQPHNTKRRSSIYLSIHPSIHPYIYLSTKDYSCGFQIARSDCPNYKDSWLFIGVLQMKIALGFVLNRVSKYIMIIIVIIINYIYIYIYVIMLAPFTCQKNTLKIINCWRQNPSQGDCPMKPPGAVRSLAADSKRNPSERSRSCMLSWFISGLTMVYGRYNYS